MTSSGMLWFHLHSPSGFTMRTPLFPRAGTAPELARSPLGCVCRTFPLMVTLLYTPAFPETPEGSLPFAQSLAWTSGPYGASWWYVLRCPSPLWWPCCACGSGSPYPSSTWATTSASESSHMTTLCAPIRFLGRSLNSGGT